MSKASGRFTIAGGVGSCEIGVSGEVKAVAIKHSGTVAGTITIACLHANAVVENMISAASANRVWTPRKPAQIPAGTDIAGSAVPYYVDGAVRVSIATGTNGHVIDAEVFYE